MLKEPKLTGIDVGTLGAEVIAALAAGKRLTVTVTYELTGGGELKATAGKADKPKGKRGRPAKAKVDAEVDTAKPKGKRGRPAKAKVDAKVDTAKPKGKRGRPAKAKTETDTAKPKGKPGRPPKAKTAPAKPKAKRGRPAKIQKPVAKPKGKAGRPPKPKAPPPPPVVKSPWDSLTPVKAGKHRGRTSPAEMKAVIIRATKAYKDHAALMDKAQEVVKTVNDKADSKAIYAAWNTFKTAFKEAKRAKRATPAPAPAPIPAVPAE